MPRLLPSAIALILTIPGCAHQEPVAPGPPLPASIELVVGAMTVECDALVEALGRWKLCPNVEPEDTQVIDFWIEEAKLDFAAGAKTTIEPQAQQAIAVRCRKATNSVTAALERCSNGHRPKP